MDWIGVSMLTSIVSVSVIANINMPVSVVNASVKIGKDYVGRKRCR